MKIVTYATHSEGKFEELINNKYGVKIDVLGWGQKWNGYRDKSIGIIEYLKNTHDDEIVIYLDGFDTNIVKDTHDLESTFKKLNCRILLSKENSSPLVKYVFGSCKNNKGANSGLYMGYAKELRQLLEKSSKFNCKDDQINLNASCSYFDNLKIDEDEIIFQNINPIFGNKKNSNPYFRSYPGTLSVKRIYRAVVNDYPQFFINTITSIVLLLMYMFPSWSPYLFVLFIVYYSVMDHSCKV